MFLVAAKQKYNKYVFFRFDYLQQYFFEYFSEGDHND